MKRIVHAMTPRNRTPPTTPPTMAPIFGLDSAAAGAALGVGVGCWVCCAGGTVPVVVEPADDIKVDNVASPEVEEAVDVVVPELRSEELGEMRFRHTANAHVSHVWVMKAHVSSDAQLGQAGEELGHCTQRFKRGLLGS